MTKRLLLSVMTLLLLLAPTAAQATWDDPLAAYMQMPESARLMLLSGYLGMFEGINSIPPDTQPETRWVCGSVTIGTIKETVEQWYRTGKLDPTVKTSTAVWAAVGSLCRQVTVPPATPRAVKPQM